MKNQAWTGLGGMPFVHRGFLRLLRVAFRSAALFGLVSLGSVYGDTLISSTGYNYGSYTYTVPANTTYLIVKAWGAGGGCWVGYLYGGAGGFAQGQVSTTPGSTFTVYVGGGGLDNSNGGGGGWPWGSSGSGGGCGGGGASAFFSSSINITAGGGGGASNAPGGVGNGGTYGTPGGLGSPGTTNGGGGGGASSSAGGAGGQNYFSGVTNTVSLGQTGFAATAVNTSDPDYPGGYLGAGGGDYIYNGNNGYVVVKAYQASIAPTFSGTLSTQNVNQNQSISYTIPASGSPAPTFSASGLPPDLTCNSATGVITGNVGIGTTGAPTFTYNSTVTATNSYGTVSGTLTWVVTAAIITPLGSISGGDPLLINDDISLVQNGRTNFSLAYTQGTMWSPNNTPTDLPETTSYQTQSYTVGSSAGVYKWQFLIVDVYGNSATEWITCGVSTSADTPPTTVQATTTGSTFVTISWSGATASAGIKSYIIYQNGIEIGTSTTTSYTDTTVVASTTYTYTVATVDNNNLSSAPSWGLAVTTAQDFELFT
jgi:hypothetical protein